MKKIITLILGLLLLSPLNSDAAPTKRVKVYADFDKPILQTGVPGTVVVKVGLLADNPILAKQRIPLNLAIVLDKSGSMGSQQKIENAKSAAIDIIERLTPSDVVSLVVYDTHAWVVMPAQHLTEKDAFIFAINQIYSGGSTALYDGVRLGQQEVGKYASPEFLNRIILLSDGLANVGPQSTPEITSLGISLSRMGTSVTTVGVGSDYNEDLMGALASAGGGNVYFAQNSDRIPEIFNDELSEAMTVAARDIRVYLECAKGVIPLGIIGRKGDIHGQNITLTIDNLYGIKEKSALFELQIPPQERKEREVARLRIEYFDPFSQQTVTEHQVLNLKFESNANIVRQAMNKGILKDAALTRNSEVKEQAITLADQGKYDQADSLLKQNAFALEKTAQQCDNDAELLNEATKNKASSWVENKRKGSTNVFRKQMKAESQSQIGEQYSPGYQQSGFQQSTWGPR